MTVDPGLSATRRDALEKYVPLVLVCAIAWLAARSVRTLFREAFGIVWVLYWTHPWHAFW